MAAEKNADVVTLKLRARAPVKPRLRFDKVVIELIGRLKSALDPLVPDDRTVIVTCTAPIRLSGKTAEALIERIAAALAREAKKDIAATIHDNAVRVRFVRARVKGGARLIGFVHNPDPGAVETLLDMTEGLIEALAAAKPKRHRTLVIANTGAPVATVWPRVYEAVAAPARYEQVLMTFADGTTQMLNGRA